MEENDRTVTAPQDAGPVFSLRPALVVGVYLLDQSNNVGPVTAELAGSRRWQVVQSWAALGAGAVPEALAGITTLHQQELAPKFSLINRLLREHDLARYDYILVCDDDISLPAGFLDAFLDCVAAGDFSLAQPALTHNSYLSHYFVAQLKGIMSRRTRFVQSGPLFSLRRDIYAEFLPFPEAAGMGREYDFIWPCVIEKMNRKMGIIDATPIGHCLRKMAATSPLPETAHRPEECQLPRPRLTPGEALRILEPGAESGRGANGGRVTLNRKSPPLSVVLCSYNRAPLLAKTLNSLIGQTLDRDAFEVVLIDNGSADGTKQVAESFADRLPLRYFFQHQFGLASGRNHGTCAAAGELLLFLDDDDIATPTLLAEHVQTHRQYPEPHYAVLNYTGWSPDLRITPLMHFVTEVEGHLFCYPGLRHGAVVDYNYFWGGRTSCKKQFLMEHGLFNPVFTFGCEDIELGYRLNQYGLRVVYNAKAVSLMARTVDLAGFCDRLVQQGHAQELFATLHDVPAVRNWTHHDGEAAQWSELAADFAAQFRTAMEMDLLVNERIEQGLAPDGNTLATLHQAYRWLFRACKIKGMAAAALSPGRMTTV